MGLLFKKQPIKYLKATDKNTRNKLYRALDNLQRLNGDIVPIAGKKDLYRFKTDHYRIVFEKQKNSDDIIVIQINTRTNINY